MDKKAQEDLIAIMVNPALAKTEIRFEDALEDKSDNIRETLKDSKPLKDAMSIKDQYGNSLLDIGTDSNSEKFNHYGFNNDTLNWPLWMALYNESWVFKRAIDKPSQDEIRCGITLIGESDKKTEIYEEVNSYSDDLIQLLMWGALFGGSIAVAMFDNFDDKDYLNSASYNKKKIKESKTMKFYVVDRWYGVAPDYSKTVTNMVDQDFGKPEYYNVTLANGETFRYHHDYILRYEHRFAPKLIKNGMLQGWGYAEGAHIINELARDEKLKTSIQSLMNKSLIEVIKMAGMRGVFMGTDSKNEEQLKKRLEMVNWGRNFNSLTFLDKDDEYSMNNFSGLTGLADLLEQNMWQIAAALEMQGVLFGELKGGLSQETDALERYDEVIKGRCESFVRPVYKKLIQLVSMRLGVEEKLNFTFNSLLAKKHDEEKMEGINKYIDTLSKLLQDGVITTKQYAKSLMNFTTNNTIDFCITEKDIEEMDDRTALEVEGIDLDNLGGIGNENN